MAEDKNIRAEDQDIANTLAELADLVKPIAGDGKISLDAFYYLLLLWASFHVYPLEPPPDGGGESGGEGGGGVKIIPLENGWNIRDYGDCLSTSPGDQYGGYCTGKLIITAQHMIDILAKRGVTKVGFLGHDVARRAAWVECVDQNIEIINYEASIFDVEVRNRILAARKKAGKIRKKITSINQRPELD